MDEVSTFALETSFLHLFIVMYIGNPGDLKTVVKLSDGEMLIFY